MNDVPTIAVPGSRAHLAWLDSLRALAALWVVAHHAFLTVTFVPVGVLQGAIFYVLNNGHYAVTTFIALSGYSLTLQTRRHGWRLRDGTRGFLLARAIRIVPPYYAAIALSLAFVATLIGRPTGTHWDISIPVSGGNVLEHVLLLQDFRGSPKINHAFWSIAIESQIYLFFGFILWGLRWRGPLGVLGVSAGLCLAGFVLKPLVERTIGLTGGAEYLLRYLFVFGLGVIACWLSAERPETGERWGGALFVTAALAMLAVPHLRLPEKDLLFGFAANVGFYALATHSGVRLLFSAQPLAFLGTFAYSLYLVHAPLLQVVYQLGGIWRPTGRFSSSMGFILVSVLICVGLAYGFYLACERPFFKMRHLLRKGRADGETA